MRNKKGFTLVEVISAIVILSIIITLGVFSITKVRSNILEKQYKNIKLEIELAAEKYYSDTESKEVYVDTLIKEGYLKADNKSMTIIDPRDKTILNCYIVTINDDEKGSLGTENNVLENGNCNENAIVNSEILIVGEDGNKIDKTWYKNPITLNVKFKDNGKDPNNYSYTWKSEKNPNIITDEKTYNLKETYEERGKVIDDEFYVTLVNGDEILESKGQRVRIDGVLPEIKSLVVPDKGTWTKDKTLKVNATDVGSGIESYILSMGDCESIPLKKYNKILDIPNPNDVKIEQKITKNGTYTFCVSDKAGNKVKYDEIISIDKIDDIPPVCSYIENTKWTKSNVAINFGCKDDESGCSKLTHKKKTTNCNGNGTCYELYTSYTYTSTYKSANISKTIGSFTIEDNAGNIVTCPSDKKEVNVYLDKDKPVISDIIVNSNNTKYKSIYTTVTITSYDLHSGVKEMCASNSSSYSNCTWVNVNGCSKSGNTYTCNIQLTIDSYEGSGDNKTVYVFSKDDVKIGVGNIQMKKTNYKLYQACTDTKFHDYGGCSRLCTRGYDKGYRLEYRTDEYLGTNCDRYGNVPCNTFDCCSSTYKTNASYGECSTTCGLGTKTIYYNLYSNIDKNFCRTDTSYESCYEDYGCYIPEPDPTPDPNPGGGGSNCVTKNSNFCNTSENKLYWISECCNGTCNYAARDGKNVSGTIAERLLSDPTNCSSYGPGGGGSGGGSSTKCGCSNNNECVSMFGSKYQCFERKCCTKRPGSRNWVCCN